MGLGAAAVHPPQDVIERAELLLDERTPAQDGAVARCDGLAATFPKIKVGLLAGEATYDATASEGAKAAVGD